MSSEAEAQTGWHHLLEYGNRRLLFEMAEATFRATVWAFAEAGCIRIDGKWKCNRVREFSDVNDMCHTKFPSSSRPGREVRWHKLPVVFKRKIQDRPDYDDLCRRCVELSTMWDVLYTHRILQQHPSPRATPIQITGLANAIQKLLELAPSCFLDRRAKDEMPDREDVTALLHELLQDVAAPDLEDATEELTGRPLSDAAFLVRNAKRYAIEAEIRRGRSKKPGGEAIEVSSEELSRALKTLRDRSPKPAASQRSPIGFRASRDNSGGQGGAASSPDPVAT